MDAIDLRSDTVTWPTPAMRHAMMEAPVGDDVYGEDPTVNDLEQHAATLFGKEAGLLVTSGTMGNVVSILAHCGRGERVIVGDESHIRWSEAGNPATLGGVQAWTVPNNPDGTLNIADVEAAIEWDDFHTPLTSLVALENTQGGLGGIPLPVEHIHELGQFCHSHNIPLHIDGARIFNAAVATQTDVAAMMQHVDSVTFCLSKGLCAPVGSIVVGSAEFIQRARRIRKAMGGGMRQAGIIAAAGRVALDEMTHRLDEDHQHAKWLAQGLAEIPSVSIDVERVQTNMVFFDLHAEAKFDTNALAQQLKADNILLKPPGNYPFRAVTHYWIKPEHIEFVLQRIKFYLS